MAEAARIGEAVTPRSLCRHDPTLPDIVERRAEPQLAMVSRRRVAEAFVGEGRSRRAYAIGSDIYRLDLG